MLPLISALALSTNPSGSVWNPSDKSGNIGLADSNRRAQWTSSGAVRGTQGRSSGLLYFEVAVVKGTLTTIGIGVAKSSYGLGGTSLGHSDSNSAGYDVISGSGTRSAISTDFALAQPSYGDGDSVGVALDFSGYTGGVGCFFSKNGSWLGDSPGTPGGGPGSPFALSAPGMLFPCAAANSSSIELLLITNVPFLHPIPSGWSAWG